MLLRPSVKHVEDAVGREAGDDVAEIRTALAIEARKSD
jgi:hypothetical protein